MREPISVRNPRSGEVDFSFSPLEIHEIEAEYRHVLANQPAWSQNLDLRLDALRAWRDEIKRSKQAIAEAVRFYFQAGCFDSQTQS